MPPGWRETTVVRHLENPFAEEALAESPKSYIDLGALCVECCTGPPQNNETIKLPGKPMTFAQEQSAELIRAHKMFRRAAIHVLGRQRYQASLIEFAFRGPDAEHSFYGRHIDATDVDVEPCAGQDSQLRLLGIACNLAPTVLFHYPLTRDQIKPNGALRPLPAIHTTETLPVNRLIVLAPSQPHSPSRWARNYRNRTLARWALTF